MKAFRFINTLFVLVFASAWALGQHVSFKSEANRKSLAVGESLQVGFFIQAEGTDYSIDSPMKYPEHNGFRLVGENKTQHVEYVNGKGLIQDGIILIFTPEREGKLRIGSARIVIDGKAYTTKPIDIEVSKSSTSALSNRANTNQPVFLQTNVSNTNPYINEQVGLTVKMYSRDLGLLNRKRNFRQGKLEGLSPKMVTSRPETIKQEMVSGKPYFSEEIAKYNLFPQREGRIEIDPFSMDILVSGIYGTEAYEIKSNPVVINAKALPEEGKPVNFTGAVGDFKLKTSINKKELAVNESANLNVEISGKGNFNTIIVPEVNTPKNIEKYPPKKKNDFKAYEDGMQGSVSTEMVMVPEYGGDYTIAAVEFSYFDPEKEKYITLKSDAIDLSVDGLTANEVKNTTDDLDLGNHGESTQNNIKTTVSELAEDVKNGNGKWLWTAGGLIAASVLGLFLLRRKKDESNELEEVEQTVSNESKFVRKVNSLIVKESIVASAINVSTDGKRIIKSKLDTLQQNIHHPDFKTFFQLQEDLLCEIGMKYSGTDLANFSDYSVGEKLVQCGWNQELVEEWKLLLNKARQAKYSAISSSNEDLTDVYFKTEKLVNQFIK
ncbi:BatD family protein [Faecalibacter macacae]|uniref:Protein BatD n=1 Tax=Faecalibacter macacae TaxID=1859289 RepID=A0A3L9M1J3_9FLAO|nr:BatD family protein [Faecalibacter macacae]RLZ06875.1 protein BatD [Faecalibacter macacae]